jgi:hypothetical protein
MTAPARTEQVLQIPLNLPKALPGAETWLELHFYLAYDQSWGSCGLEIANAQVMLPAQPLPLPRLHLSRIPSLSAERTGKRISCQGEEFSLEFDTFLGLINHWEYQGTSVISHAPELNLWRAPTDNDVHMAKEWRKAGLDRLQPNVRRVELSKVLPQAIQIDTETIWGGYSLRPALRCNQRYSIYGTGDVFIDTQVTPLTVLPNLPRLGLQMRLPGKFDRFSWFGRGPHENYPDRQESAFIGVYSGSVAEQYVPYVLPQEYGNKCEVRWAAVTDAQGLGLLACAPPGNDLLNISVQEYPTEALTLARHTYELKPCGETILNLDHRQCGLGSNSCGPGPLDKYLVPARNYRYTVRLRPFSGDILAAETLYRQVLEAV